MFEIGRSFGDEPADPTHSPEYSLVKLYQAGADDTPRATARELIVAVARAVLDGIQIRSPTRTCRRP